MSVGSVGSGTELGGVGHDRVDLPRHTVGILGPAREGLNKKTNMFKRSVTRRGV